MHQKGNPWTEWVTVGNLLTERFCHAVLTIGPQQLPCLSWFLWIKVLQKWRRQQWRCLNILYFTWLSRSDRSIPFQPILFDFKSWQDTLGKWLQCLQIKTKNSNIWSIQDTRVWKNQKKSSWVKFVPLKTKIPWTGPLPLSLFTFHVFP